VSSGGTPVSSALIPISSRVSARDRPLRISECWLSLADKKLGRRNTEPIRQIEKPLIDRYQVAAALGTSCGYPDLGKMFS